MTVSQPAPGPRYLELRAILAAEIRAGAYIVGARYPTDEKLCARFGVSRHTVREALRALQAEGLIARQPGAGTVVRALQAADPYVQSAATLEELSRYAGETWFRLHHEGFVQLGRDLAVELGRPVGERWMRFAGVRGLREPSVVLAWTEIFVTEALADVRRHVRADGPPVYRLLEAHLGVEGRRVEQRIGAVAMPTSAARVLGAEPGEPALLLRRRYFADLSGDEPFEISLSVHPHDRFAHTAWLQRK